MIQQLNKNAAKKVNKSTHKVYFNKFHWTLIAIMLAGCVAYLPLYYTQVFDINNIYYSGAPTWLNQTLCISMPIISVIAGISNLFCIILLANKKISNFIFGAIAVILFAIVAVITKQWLFAVLNGLYYLPFQFVGIHTWKKDLTVSGSEVKVKSMNKKIFLTILGCTIVVGVGVGLIIDIPAIAKALGMDEGTKDWLYYAGLIINGITMCASIVAFQIAIREYKENWIIWICSNVAVLILWSISIAENIELHENAKVFTSAFTLFTYSFSFVNSIYGYLNWSKK